MAHGDRRERTAISHADFDAVIFDLDGVITRTAEVHFLAWKRMFDEYLSEWARREGREQAPFDGLDYQRHVDGRPRYEGVKTFLASRGIELPQGSPEDGPDKETIRGLGNRKNEMFRALLRQGGVRVFEHAVALVRALREKGFRTAVVTSSRNGRDVLDAAGITDLFDVRVDGLVAAELGLPGKPAPDAFLKAAELLGVEPSRAAVFEDAESGVEAGRRGHFRLVVGVDRVGHGPALARSGAHVVVTDLAEIEVRQ